MASTDIGRLANFQKHFEDMRALIHCKICLKPFYEPYTLPCGHTYCYSCLSSWCSGTHNRGKSKTCPDCRATVTTQPSPNFLLRDLVQMFLTHTELLPEDESVEEHAEGKATESSAVAADKAGPGLFKGVFQRRRYPSFPAVPIVDAQDGVERCPICAWELEEGECGQCGWGIDEDGSLGSYNSDEDDRDISPIDDFGGPIDIRVGRPAFGPYTHHMGVHHDFGDLSEDYDDEYVSPAAYSVEDEDDESESGDDGGDDDDMNSFISNDEDDDLPNEIDDDDGSIRTILGYNTNSPARQYSTDGGYTNDTDGPRQESSPPRQFFGIDLTENSDGDDSSSEDNATISGTTEATTEDGETGDDASEQQTNYDTDSSVREISPPPVIAQIPRLNRAKRRRVILDDEDDEEESEELDDIAIRPPQAGSTRMQRLRGQRERRGNNAQGSQVSTRRRVFISSDDDIPRSGGRRGGRSWQPEGANAIPVARRGRMVATRVH